MFFIFAFAACCIIGSLFLRDLDSSTPLGAFLSYTVSFESKFYDYRMRSQIDRNYVSKEIVLLKIDDYSLQKLGVWPIPRGEYAKMLAKLKTFGAKVVTLDILYPEKSPAYGGISPDTVFAESIRDFQQDGRRVILSYPLAAQDEETLPEAPVEMLNDLIQTNSAPGVELEPRKIAKYAFPIEELVATEAGLAFISSNEDTDGFFRQYSVLANIDTIYYGSLALNTYEAYTGKKLTAKVFSDATGSIEIDGHVMEISHKGETKIRYLGGDVQFKGMSLYDLLKAKDTDRKMKAFFDNKIVYVGSTALGAHDLRPSPIDNKMPGVYAHINFTQMLLNKYFLKSGDESVKYSIALLILGMLIFLFAQRFGNPFIDAAVVIAIIAGTYFIDYYYFLPQGYELKLFYNFFCQIACYSWNTFLQFYEANKEKKQIKGTFNRYVSPAVVNEMLKDPSKLQIGGTKMDITCLFSDVRDFTSISEGLTPTELSHSLNFYMNQMTDVVFETKGTLDKYIGDAIVAIWGAPIEIGNHAQYAVEGAIKMITILPAINEEFKRLGRPVFNVGVGLNTGDCSVGNMGSDRIFSYTALGDNMNLGARLEGLCKYYGTQILISEMTLSRLDLTNIKVRPIDKVIVKGKTLPVAIYEVLHPHHPMTKEPAKLELYLKATQHFQEKKFIEAALLLEDLDDRPSRRILALCHKYIEQPDLVDEQFDVTTMKEK